MCLLYIISSVIYKKFYKSDKKFLKEKKLNIVSARKLINYIKLYVLWQVILVTISGCDVCTNNDTEGKPQFGDIFFTAVPLAKDIPSIYSIKPTGDNLREIVSNGVLFSNPSNNGKLAYLRFTELGNELRLCNVDGSNDLLVLRDDKIPEGTITYPIISPTGEYILFVGGRNVLYSVDNKGQTVYRITLKMIEETLPSFSFDGKYFAIFESNGDNSGFLVKIFDSKTRKEVYSKHYNEGLKGFNGISRIDWSDSDYNIIYSLRFKKKDIVYISNIMETGVEKVFVIDSSIGSEMPTLSPDGAYFAFVTKTGDIFIRNTDTINPEFRQITFNTDYEVNKYPEWSNDGGKILYHNYFKFDDQGYKASLILMNNIFKEPNERQSIIIRSNNVLRGFFW